jgi:hypothetical protein
MGRGLHVDRIGGPSDFKLRRHASMAVNEAPLFYVHSDAKYMGDLIECSVAHGNDSDLEKWHQDELWNPLVWDPRGGVAAELAFCQNAMRHPRRTENILEAEVIIMCIHARLNTEVPTCENGGGHQDRKLHLIQQIRDSPAWHAGKPHFLFGATEYGIDSEDGLGRQDFIVYGNPSHWFDWKHHIHMPYASNIAFMDTSVKHTVDFEADNWATRHRETLLFFRGTLGFGSTRSGLTSLNDFPRIKIEDKSNGGCPTQDDYASNMLKSEFCLTPSGHTCTSRRYYDAVAAGCIPIIIDCQNEEYPFDAAINYSSFTLYYPLEAITARQSDFIDCLDRVSRTPDFMVPRVQALKDARDALIYGWYNVDGSGDTSILDGTWKAQQPSHTVDYLVQQISSLPPVKRDHESMNSINLEEYCR